MNHRLAIPAALIAGLALSGCASENWQSYLPTCGAQAVKVGEQNTVRYTPDQANCAQQMANNARAENQRVGQAVAMGLAAGAVGGAAGYAYGVNSRPVYYNRMRTCHSTGQVVGGVGRTYSTVTNCF